MPLSVADQDTDQLGGPLSVLVRQKNDHIALNALLEELGRTRGEEQDEVLHRIDRLVFPHAFAEEAVLWPVMRRVLPDGEELTLEVEQEHQEVNELVARLDRLGHDDPDRPAVLERLVEVLREDVRDEEDELFPRLQERVGRLELQLLGIVWEVLRRTAPTRAHPVVARRPPGNAVAAVPLSVLDRLRDVADASARSRGGQRAGAVSRRLGAVAEKVEHLPLLRRGEDASTSVDPVPAVPWGALGVGAAALGAVLLLRRRR